ncbi:MAG TPA: hypothetical protein VIC08_12105 [Cellvibrionaceae bacterium]
MYNQFSVNSDAACVQGHFPGMPVVPGAWLLGRAHSALLARFPACRVAELKKVKFLAPLLPEQLAILSIDDSRWPRIKVTLAHAEQLLLEASFVLVEDASAQ